MDAADTLAQAWFDLGDPGCTARSCPECPKGSAHQGATGYYTSATDLARHMRQVHNRTGGRRLEVT